MDPCLKCAHVHYSSKPCKKGKCKYKDCRDKGSDHAFNLCPEVLNLIKAKSLNLVKADPPQLSNTAVRRKNERNNISKTNYAHDAFISPLIYSHTPNGPILHVDNSSSDSASLCSSNSFKSVSSVDQVNTMPELIQTVNIEGRSTALPTGIYSVINSKAPNLTQDQRSVSALLDTAAQRTLITRDSVLRLGLETIRSEQACLMGYGERKSVNTSFDVVKISLGSKHADNKVEFDAYVVDKLNKLHMFGVAQFAKKFANKGVRLADTRLANLNSDSVSLDLLVGADHFYKVVSPYKLPIERSGMRLIPDRFGNFLLCGKIPGSCEYKKAQQINFVSLYRVDHVPKDLQDFGEARDGDLAKSNKVQEVDSLKVDSEARGCDASECEVKVSKEYNKELSIK